MQGKNGKPWCRLLLAVDDSDGHTLISIKCFAGIVEQVRVLSTTTKVRIACRLSGTEFKDAGGKVKRGVQLTAETLTKFQTSAARRVVKPVTYNELGEPTDIPF